MLTFLAEILHDVDSSVLAVLVLFDFPAALDTMDLETRLRPICFNKSYGLCGLAHHWFVVLVLTKCVAVCSLLRNLCDNIPVGSLKVQF